MRDIEPGAGGLQVIPGSHKANYPPPPGDALRDMYLRLFEDALEGSWLKYLLRAPNGFLETYPKPENMPAATMK